MYLPIFYLCVLSVFVSAIGGFFTYKVFHKYFKVGALTYILGGLLSLLLSYLMALLMFGGTLFYSVTIALLAIVLYVLFLLISNDNPKLNLKWVGIVVLALIIIGSFYLITISSKKGTDQTYLLPMDFEGCVVINYEVEGFPPLKIESNVIEYLVPESGIINTSSPAEFGWAYEEHSGPSRLKAFYVDENGKKVKELSQEEFRSSANGAVQEEGKQERRYHYQIFGSKEVDSQGCPAAEISQ